MLINNNHGSQYNKNIQFKQNSKFNNSPISKAQMKTKVAEVGIGVAGGTILAVSLFSPLKALAKNIMQKISGGKLLNKLVKTEIKDKRSSEEITRSFFIQKFVEGVKKPFMTSKTGDKKLTPIPNGLMLTGPDSKAKEDRFNWMLEELKKAGAEIIDPGEGKKAKFDKVSEAWHKMWKSNDDAAFQKNGKYRVFVVRGVDELGQPKGYPEGYLKFPEGSILKDTPDSNESRAKHGIMLFYTCKNPSRLDPAVIRPGRIDVQHSVMPYQEESLDIWKAYLDDMKWEKSPASVVKKLGEAKEILSKKGDNVLREMNPHLQYTVPYVPPKAGDSLEKWNEYVFLTSQNVDRKKCNSYLLDAVSNAHGELNNTAENKEKFQKIVKMTEDIQRPEDLVFWKSSLRFELAGENVAYSNGTAETGSEYAERMRKRFDKTV